MDGPNHDAELALLRMRLRKLGLSEYEAWMNYLRCGGTSAFLEFEAYLFAALVLPALDREVLQHSIWEAEEF